MGMQETLTAAFTALAKRISHLEQTNYQLAVWTFVNLPATSVGQQPQTAFCSNCRKSGEGAGNGTGVPIFNDGQGGGWKRAEDNAVVSA